MSDANRVGLAYVEESTFGEVPSGPPTLKDYRFASESLGQETSRTTSQELRSDRQIVDEVRTNVSASGEITGEFSYGPHDDFLAAVVQATAWSSPVTISGTVYSMAAADNSLNRSSGDFVADGIVAKQWIRVSGFATAANNGLFKVVSVATTKLVLSHGGAVVNESAGPTVTIVMGGQVVNGTAQKTYSIEKAFLDVASTFETLHGMGVNTFGIGVSTDGIITTKFGFLGKNAASGTSTIGDGSNTAAPTAAVMNAVDHVLAVIENGSTLGVTSLGLDINNNMRARQQVATLGAISLGSGSIGLSGSLQAYFTSATLFNKYLNYTATDLVLKFQDEAGNQYVFEMPQVKFTSGKRVAGGLNQDVIADLQYTAYMDPTEGITVRIARFAA